MESQASSSMRAFCLHNGIKVNEGFSLWAWSSRDQLAYRLVSGPGVLEVPICLPDALDVLLLGLVAGMLFCARRHIVPSKPDLQLGSFASNWLGERLHTVPNFLHNDRRLSVPFYALPSIHPRKTCKGQHMVQFPTISVHRTRQILISRSGAPVLRSRSTGEHAT